MGGSALLDVTGLEALNAADYLWGVLETKKSMDGWVRPFRFSAAQRRALTSCLAWHPGIYRQMSATTSGVCVRFTTDATRVVLAVRVDAEPPAMEASLQEVRGLWDAEGGEEPFDGVSVVVDGRPLGVYEPQNDVVSINLMDPVSDPGMGVIALPGLGKKRHVAIWLPCMHDCEIRELWTDGTFVRRETSRRRLLVIGDASAQGFCSADPACTWPALLAERLGLELVNHSMAGMVFQPFFAQCEEVPHVEHVVVAVGESYRDERCDAQTFLRDAKGFFATIRRAFPDARLWAVTPMWYDEQVIAPRRGSCYEDVPRIVAECAQECGAQLVDGLRLLDHSASLMADHACMPGDRAHLQISERLHAMMLVAQVSEEELVAKAMEVLSEAVREDSCLKPLFEIVRRGLCRVLYAASGCVLAMLHDGSQILYAANKGLSLAVCELYAEADAYHVFGENTARWLVESFGLVRSKSRHVCLYEGSKALSIEPSREECIHTLEESQAEEVLKRVGTWAEGEDEVLESLRSGRFIGAFAGDKLIGFIGERSDGCMGPPEVFGKYKRDGWAEDLEKTKINAHLAAGEMPWMEVYPQNKSLLRLQYKLGLSVMPANEACIVDRAQEEMAHEVVDEA